MPVIAASSPVRKVVGLSGYLAFVQGGNVVGKRYVGETDQRPLAPALGDLFFDSTLDALLVNASGGWEAIGTGTSTGGGGLVFMGEWEGVSPSGVYVSAYEGAWS